LAEKVRKYLTKCRYWKIFSHKGLILAYYNKENYDGEPGGAFNIGDMKEIKAYKD
jgi:hypothetical protein